MGSTRHFITDSLSRVRQKLPSSVSCNPYCSPSQNKMFDKALSTTCRLYCTCGCCCWPITTSQKITSEPYKNSRQIKSMRQDMDKQLILSRALHFSLLFCESLAQTIILWKKACARSFYFRGHSTSSYLCRARKLETLISISQVCKPDTDDWTHSTVCIYPPTLPPYFIQLCSIIGLLSKY